jgi:hypothetical protein
MTLGIDNALDIGSGSFRMRNVHIAGAIATGVKAGAAIDADVSNPTDGIPAWEDRTKMLLMAFVIMALTRTRTRLRWLFLVTAPPKKVWRLLPSRSPAA